MAERIAACRGLSVVHTTCDREELNMVKQIQRIRRCSRTLYYYIVRLAKSAEGLENSIKNHGHGSHHLLTHHIVNAGHQAGQRKDVSLDNHPLESPTTTAGFFSRSYRQTHLTTNHTRWRKQQQPMLGTAPTNESDWCSVTDERRPREGMRLLDGCETTDAEKVDH